MKVLSVKNLHASYITEVFGINRTVKAVNNVNLDIYENEIYGIAGESGCGKTTLIKILTGTYKPPLIVSEGEVIYDPENTTVQLLSSNKKKINDLKWKYMSYIPQGSMNVLNPLQKIKKSFYQFIKAHDKNISKGSLDDMIKNHFVSLGLKPSIADMYPHQLSGGMKQRVTIGLATVLAPKISIGDEPTTALDVIVQRGVIQLFKNINQNHKTSFIIVTHDLSVHANLATRIGIMYAGQIVEEGSTTKIFNSPKHPYTQFLIDSLPSIGDRKIIKNIPGSPPPLDNLPLGCSFYPRCPISSEKCRTEKPVFLNIDEGQKSACHNIN